MKFKYIDFNGADKLLGAKFANEWDTLEKVFSSMPLHLKASDQKGKVGANIFSTVGTNNFIKQKMVRKGWNSSILIPEKLDYLGTDVDFSSNGLFLEVQFSNYPFLTNNVIRSELFFKTKASFISGKFEMLIIVTKAGQFPAGNSSLYYEQAVKQITGLEENKMFSVPIRLVGLFECVGSTVPCVYGKYSAPRYSRTIIKTKKNMCQILPGKRPNSKWRLEITK